MKQQCRSCKRELPFSEFNKDKHSKTGYRNLCWICSKAQFANHKAVHEGKGGELTGLEIVQQLEEQDHICEYWSEGNLHCKKELTRQNMVIDHVLPFAEGGLNIISNIVCSCNTCNNRKFTMSYDQAHEVLGSHDRLKYCRQCRKVLPVELFRMTGSQKFGREGWCNECKNRNQRVRYSDAGATREHWQELLRGIV